MLRLLKDDSSVPFGSLNDNAVPIAKRCKEFIYIYISEYCRVFTVGIPFQVPPIGGSKRVLS